MITGPKTRVPWTTTAVSMPPPPQKRIVYRTASRRKRPTISWATDMFISNDNNIKIIRARRYYFLFHILYYIGRVEPVDRVRDLKAYDGSYGVAALQLHAHTQGEARIFSHAPATAVKPNQTQPNLTRARTRPNEFCLLVLWYLGRKLNPPRHPPLSSAITRLLLLMTRYVAGVVSAVVRLTDANRKTIWLPFFLFFFLPINQFFGEIIVFLSPPPPMFIRPCRFGRL